MARSKINAAQGCRHNPKPRMRVWFCGFGAHLMQWVTSSEDPLTQQTVDSHLPLFWQTIWSPGQDLIQLKGRQSQSRDVHWNKTNRPLIHFHGPGADVTSCLSAGPPANVIFHRRLLEISESNFGFALSQKRTYRFFFVVAVE